MGRSLPQETQLEIIRSYEDGESGNQIADRLHISSSTVTRMVRRSGKRLRQTRKYNLDEHFFDNIDNETKAYWLGWISADGCVYQNYLSTFVQERDQLHIEKFRNALNSNYPIRTKVDWTAGKAFRSIGIEISSKWLVKALLSLGITPKKSLSLKPAQVSEELQPAYFRGLFDGDGSIGFPMVKTGNPHSNIRVILVGTQPIVSAFATFCGRFADVEATVHRRRGKNLWYVNYGGITVPQAILHALYDDATVYLDRKYAAAQQAFGLSSRKLRRLDITGSQVYETYHVEKTWYKTAKKLGVPLGSRRSLQRLYYQYCKEQGLPCQQG